MRGHPASDLVRFVHDDLMAGLESMIGGGKPHRAGADDGYALHNRLRLGKRRRSVTFKILEIFIQSPLRGHSSPRAKQRR